MGMERGRDGEVNDESELWRAQWPTPEILNIGRQTHWWKKSEEISSTLRMKKLPSSKVGCQ